MINGEWEVITKWTFFSNLSIISIILFIKFFCQFGCSVLSGSSNTKINSLNLIFPNEFGQKIIESDYFEPTIELTASKPNFENELKLFINRILEQNISENLIIK